MFSCKISYALSQRTKRKLSTPRKHVLQCKPLLLTQTDKSAYRIQHYLQKQNLSDKNHIILNEIHVFGYF